MTEKNLKPPPQPSNEPNANEEKELSQKEAELKKEIADLDAELLKIGLNAQLLNDTNQISEPDPFPFIFCFVLSL